jgi:mitochondrial-processing peptidase subunit alpha
MWKLAHGAFDADSPMSSPFPGIPTPSDAPVPVPGAVTVTSLSNGIRIASKDDGGAVAALGVFVGAGSRHETPYTAGATHLLEHLAFKGSSARSKYRMTRDVERTGASFAAAASRETLAYTAEVTRGGNVADVIAIMAESATTPAVAISDPESISYDAARGEIATHVAIMKSELAQYGTDAAGKVTEAIHAAAFHGNTLGMFDSNDHSSIFFCCLTPSQVLPLSGNETRECVVAAFATAFAVVVSAPP